MVGHVTCGEYARDVGGSGVAFTAAADHQVAVLEGQLAFEQRGIRGVADGDEHAVYLDLVAAAIVVLQARAGHAHVVAQDFIQGSVQLELDLAFGNAGMQLVDQDLLGAEGIAAVHQGYLAGDVGQVQRLFNGRVAAANHRDRLVAVEEAIAGGAGRYTLAHERFFRRQAQVTSAGTSGHDQGVTGVGAAVAGQRERLVGQVYGVDVVEDDFSFETLGVFLHALHQCRAGQAVRVARPVVDFGGGGQLATGLHASDQQRLEVGTGRVDRCAVTGRAGAQNDDARMTCFGHVELLSSGL